MTMRINEPGLEDLAEYTRTWMFNTAVNSGESEFLKHWNIGRRLTLDGEFVLENVRITGFEPPNIKYTPNKNSLLYASTQGGLAQVCKLVVKFNFRLLTNHNNN